MDTHEIRAAVAGVLAIAAEQAEEFRTGAAHPSGDIDVDPVDLLTRELGYLQMQLPADTPPEEVAQRVSEVFIGRIGELILAFSSVFVGLALVHDNTDPEIRSADVVRALAMKWAEEANS